MDRAIQKPAVAPLIDRFGRQVTYLRLSVTDRCDLRCTYCMKPRPEFLPKSELLTLEELTVLCDAFIARGVTKIRITGGEPLVRKDIMTLIGNLGARIGRAGLEELCLTTNATQLPLFADNLAAAGMRRINISLDTLDPESYRTLTRTGRLDRVLAGVAAAKRAGLHVKLNAVAIAGVNENHLDELIRWAHGEGHDVSLIEVMPVGEVEADRSTQFLSLQTVRDRLEQHWTLTDLPDNTGGPAHYVRIEETGGRLGFISPLSGNFCGSCNRVRVTCTGQLYTCLGRNGVIDLRSALRGGGPEALEAALEEGMASKPKGHEFDVSPGAPVAVDRNMARTGG